MVDKPPPDITFFSNQPGHRKGTTLGNGQIAINQADGVMETQTPAGVPRETRLGMIQPDATNVPFAGYSGLASGSVQSALQQLWDGKAGAGANLSSFTNDAGFITASGARSAVSASGSLSYNSATGVFSYTTPANVSAFTNDSAYVTAAGARSAVSASGSLSYNIGTGVFSYTQPTNVSAFTNDAAYVNQAGARSAISATGSLSYNSSTGVISYTAPAALVAAAASDVRTGTDTAKFVTASALMSAAAFVTDTWSSTLTPDFSTGFNRTVTLTGNTTFGQPTNMKDGEPFVYIVAQDATGSRTIAFSTTYWKFPGGTVPTASTTASAVDRLTGIMRNRGGTLVCEVFGYDKDIK